MVDPGYPQHWGPPPPQYGWNPSQPQYAQPDPYQPQWVPDGYPPPTGWPIPGRPKPAIRSWAAIVAVTALAIVLALVAPFLTLWTFKTGGESRTSLSGWAVTSGGGSLDNAGGHDTRYGIVLYVGAAILIAAFVVLLVRRTATAGGLLAGLGGTFLAGIAAEAVADYSSRLSYNSSQYGDWGGGTGLWLMVIAGALGVAAAVLAIVATART